MKDDSIFNLPEEKVNQIKEKYDLLEPLLGEPGEYFTPKKEMEYRLEVAQRLKISLRTLRRYLQKVKKNGLTALARKERSDAGQNRVINDKILKRAGELIEENPFRSIPTLMRLLKAQEDITDQVRAMSGSTLYQHLKKQGVILRKKTLQHPKDGYIGFEARYANRLWQGDARHGIPLPNPNDPGKTKMTYLFAWMDDFSRQIMYARYYWDEKLPRMEDSFRQAVLRWGIPERIYCDNGRVYIAKAFLAVVNDLDVRKIHHPPYQAWCKGKVESVMRRIKQFQEEARMADFGTIEELNSALNAWIHMEYHRKIHSSTGQTPIERYRQSIQKKPPRRIKDLEKFNDYFLMREHRKVDKHKRIKLQNNAYELKGLPIGTTVEVRFDPFDLSSVHIYHESKFYQKLTASKISNQVYKNIPHERPVSKKVSRASRDYFQKLREEHMKEIRLGLENVNLSNLNEE